MNELPQYIKKELEDFKEENPSFDKPLEDYTVEELFSMYLTWQGIIGYSSIISNTLDEIRRFKQKPIDQKIKPCPFCGRVDLVMTTVKQFSAVSCSYCLAQGPAASTPENAITLWTFERRN